MNVSAYKSHSGAERGAEACLPLLTLTDTLLHTHTPFFECTPFSCRHKLPLTDAAARMIYGQSEKKKSPVDLQSGLRCVRACGAHVDVQCERNYLFILQMLERADLTLFMPECD